MNEFDNYKINGLTLVEHFAAIDSLKKELETKILKVEKIVKELKKLEQFVVKNKEQVEASNAKLKEINRNYYKLLKTLLFEEV